MVDSGVRIAAAFLPAGVPVVVGIVLAVLRRRVAPRVSRLAVGGLALQLVILLISTFLVGFLGYLPARGWSPEQIRTLSSVLGLVVIALQLVSWPLILLALFVRLPAEERDRTPTGRHALLDERGAQVVAEEGTTLLPVAAGGAVGIAGAGALAAPGFGRAPDDRPRDSPPPDAATPTEAFPVQPGARPPGSPGTVREDGAPDGAPPDEPSRADTVVVDEPDGEDTDADDERPDEGPADDADDADDERVREPTGGAVGGVESDPDDDDDGRDDDAPEGTDAAGDVVAPVTDADPDVDAGDAAPDTAGNEALGDETPDDEAGGAADPPTATPTSPRTPLAVTSVRPATQRPAPASHPGPWAGSAGPTGPETVSSTDATDTTTSTEPEEHPWFTPTGTGRRPPARPPVEDPDPADPDPDDSSDQPANVSPRE